MPAKRRKRRKKTKRKPPKPRDMAARAMILGRKSQVFADKKDLEHKAARKKVDPDEHQ